MSAEVKKEIQLEIGHVLFIDIVGYSKLLITEQSEQLQTLKQIVRGAEQFRAAEAEGKLLRLPTGDSGALGFRTSPEAPVLCAMEIAKALKDYPKLGVRMGIHSGPVNEITDLNEQANIAGAGINIAQRIIDWRAVSLSRARVELSHASLLTVTVGVSSRRSGLNPLIIYCQDQPPFALALRSVDLPEADPMLDKP